MKMRFHSHRNEFDLHVNEISFSYERMSTKTRFGKEAKGNSEMAYYKASLKPGIDLRVRVINRVRVLGSGSHAPTDFSDIIPSPGSLRNATYEFTFAGRHPLAAFLAFHFVFLLS